jgi:hypothetical protein
MNSILIAIVGVVYFIIAVDSIRKGQIGLGISFIGYSLGNVGLFMIAKQ